MEGTAVAILEIGGILIVAALAGTLARAVRLPAVVGYLIVGLAVSPFTPGFVADPGQIELFADIGVALLLFEVGIEIDPLKLGREKRRYLWLVPVHTVGLIGVTAGIGLGLGIAIEGALLLGVAVTLSSSVVAVNITRSRTRTTTTQTNHAILAWSVVQDLTGVIIATAVIAFMGLDGASPAAALVGIVGFVVVTVLAGWSLPRVLGRLRGQPDLFLIVSVGSGLLLAAVGDIVFGVPLALAAFLAGLAISEGPVMAEARAMLLPFRDLFAVMFFVSVGMLIDPSGVPSALAWIAAVLLLVVGVKGATIALASRWVALPGVSPLQQGLALGQMGEFSFVLASIGLAAAALPSDTYTAILVGIAVSIAISTVAVRAVRPRVSTADHA